MMGTANTMGCLIEALGMSPTGCGTMLAVDARRPALAREAGRLAIACLRRGLTPRQIVTRPAIENAMADLKEALKGDDSAAIQAKTDADVRRALARAETGALDLTDFQALVSPAAAPHLERLAQLSHERTVRRFGRTMQLFAPAYLSNECQNVCTYCGFSAGNKVARRTLHPAEILREAGALKSYPRPD